MLTLVGDKKVRSFHVPEVNAATLKPILREQIDKAAMVFTDEASYYRGLRADFPAGHFTVQHNIGEHVRGGATVNGCENYFSILKRGINGVYQHVSPTHLKRYVGEFDFRFNNRVAIGRQRFRAHREGCQGRGRQAAHLSKNSSATRSRSDLAARLIGGATATLPLRTIRASCLSGSMNRRSLDHLVNGALKSLPRVGMKFDPLFFGRCRLRSVSRRTRHSAKAVIGNNWRPGAREAPGAPRPVASLRADTRR